MAKSSQTFNEILWHIYNRPAPLPWQADDGNLPWNDPVFSERMLREHLDESHGAASRTTAERTRQLAWLWQKLALEPDSYVLDVTCGPGLYAVPLAQRGCRVQGVDFSPASITHARALAQREDVARHCTFVQQDVRATVWAGEAADAALFLYGQLAVFRRDEAQALLTALSAGLRPGGRLCLELLDPAQIDKQPGTWWFADDKGLWGERPFLHLGERYWHAAERIAVERYTIIELETAVSREYHLCDQAYDVEEMAAMLKQAGFSRVDVYPAWDGVPLYDVAEWIVYVAQK